MLLQGNQSSLPGLSGPKRHNCVNYFTLGNIIILMETIKEFYQAPIRRFSAAAATSREGQRSPRLGREGQHRRWAGNGVDDDVVHIARGAQDVEQILKSLIAKGAFQIAEALARKEAGGTDIGRSYGVSSEKRAGPSGSKGGTSP